MSITATGLTLAILTCGSLTAPHDAPCSETQALDVQQQATTQSSLPPDSVPRALFKALGTVSGKPLRPGTYIKDIVIVDFDPGTPAAARQAAFEAVGGVVVGGRRHAETPSEGVYYVRVRGGTASSLLRAVRILQQLPQVSFASSWALTLRDYESSRLPRGPRDQFAGDLRGRQGDDAVHDPPCAALDLRAG